MRYFLLSFNRHLGEVVGTIEQFEDPDAAVRARFRLEAHMADPNVEIVVLGAADEGALRTTHSRYFGGPDLNRLEPVSG
ncbi:MAG: hypothetical protein ACRDY1_08905 [Acidimicrobiales bacterium]